MFFILCSLDLVGSWAGICLAFSGLAYQWVIQCSLSRCKGWGEGLVHTSRSLCSEYVNLCNYFP